MKRKALDERRPSRVSTVDLKSQVRPAWVALFLLLSACAEEEGILGEGARDMRPQVFARDLQVIIPIPLDRRVERFEDSGLGGYGERCEENADCDSVAPAQSG